MVRWFLMLILVFLVSCNSSKNRPSHVTGLDPGMAHNLILQQGNNPSFMVIDVRTPEEFSTGHIRGAINIDWLTNKDALNQLDKDHTLLIYCESGRRSQLAMNHLAKKGFKYLFHINGGLIKWKKTIQSLVPSPKNEH